MMINEKPGQVGFGRALKDFFRGYVDFLGRSTRAGYWWLQLLLGVIYTIWGGWFIWRIVVDVLNQGTSFHWQTYLASGIGILLFIIVMFLPNLALKVRRFRDAGITGRGSAVLLIVQYALSTSMGVNVYSTAYKQIEFLGQNAKVAVAANSTAELLMQSLSAALGLFFFVVTVLPTDTMLTSSKHGFWRFFLRRREDTPRVL